MTVKKNRDPEIPSEIAQLKAILEITFAEN
jgi:hypothetical protein